MVYTIVTSSVLITTESKSHFSSSRERFKYLERAASASRPPHPYFPFSGSNINSLSPTCLIQQTSSSFAFLVAFTQRNLKCPCHSQSVTLPLFKEKTDLQSVFFFLDFTFYAIHIKI